MTLRRPVGFTDHARAWDTPSIAQQRHFHVVALDQRGPGHAPDRHVAERMARTPADGRLVEVSRAVHTLREDDPETGLAALRDFLGFA